MFPKNSKRKLLLPGWTLPSKSGYMHTNRDVFVIVKLVLKSYYSKTEVQKHQNKIKNRLFSAFKVVFDS